MTNIEIKARYENAARAEENLNALGAGLAGTFHQKDTYFNVDDGRLKLRELGTDEGHLMLIKDCASPAEQDTAVWQSFPSPDRGWMCVSKLVCVALTATEVEQGIDELSRDWQHWHQNNANYLLKRLAEIRVIQRQLNLEQESLQAQIEQAYWRVGVSA